MNLGLHYQKFPIVLEGYNNADWNTLSDDSKETSGYIFSIVGGVISWKFKKQTILAQSTMESKTLALASSSSRLAKKLAIRYSLTRNINSSCLDPLQ